MFRETPLDSNRMEDLLSELLPCLALALGGSQSTRTAFPQEGSLLTSFQPAARLFHDDEPAACHKHAGE